MNGIIGKTYLEQEKSKQEKKFTDEQIRLMWSRINQELKEQRITLYNLANKYDFAPSPVYQNIKDTVDYFEKKKANKLTGDEKQPVDTSVYVLCSIAKALKRPLDYFFYDNYEAVQKDRQEKMAKNLDQLIHDEDICPSEKVIRLMDHLTPKQQENIRLHILSYFD